MRSILLDTNLLVLLVVGFYDKKLISKHKKTKAFTEEDYDLLTNCINQCNTICVTSHCLAETSNLLTAAPDKIARNLLIVLKAICDQEHAFEKHHDKKHIFAQDCFPRLGVADSGLLLSAKNVDHILTDDLDAYLEISKQYPDKTYNFTHLRQNNFF